MSQAAVLDQLRGRIQALQGGPTRLSVPTAPSVEGLVQLRTGAVYSVDSTTLAMELAAGASQAGEWVGFAGWDDFGAEAAHQRGIELSRTVLVPAPGEHWLEVTAALVDVLKVVVLRPPGTVDAKSASILDARLRSRSGVLVVQGDWPRCEARLSAVRTSWEGIGRGSGRLRERRIEVVVRRGAGPPARAEVVA
ncbi:hypothetical protein JK386_17130 [Nocardioides sp. zg-536]|uniref:Uncharacterized protein n=1 Tax=Nocardioides faecalis TaxID=2803858 RepID=A0A938Y3P0_9ACTN|nr:hypothetical protein [Nocardioides faecalis]MBM9461627.1 hypothetical protein [Nocardioides faecalis]MBS4753743.1 hypothetical protein [Nocardioides faecalis]QVI57413.1 hypothetical protein KG111_09795 [Nocardioides faecalis]